MGKRMKIGNITWAVCLSIMSFIILAALWIRRTYGTLLFAMTDESFRNGLQNKRTLFVKDVILPVSIIFLFLSIVHVMYKKMNRHRAAYIAALFMAASVMGAGMILDAGPCLWRIYRLNQQQWYDVDNVIAHALGSIDGIAYTNSREALENSYQNGYRLFECDLTMTSDGEIVACHDWEFWNREIAQAASGNEDFIPTLDTFMNHKIREKYTPVSGEDLVMWMENHPDVYIITDTKYAEPEKIKEEFGALTDVAVENDCMDVLDRFVVQIYHGYMYDIVNDIYPFQNYIYTLYEEGYRGEEDKMQEYAQFCMLRDIDVITMNEKFYGDELLEICNRFGIQMFVHTVNDEEMIREFHEKGIGVYTDNT